MKNFNPLTIFGIVFVFAVGGMIYVQSKNAPDTQAYAELAQCIADSDAKFYGAFWCPACQQQKTAFGAAQEQLPYVECSTPDGQGQLDVCATAGVTSYPTWTFADGSTLSGVRTPQELAEVTGCTLPDSE